MDLVVKMTTTHSRNNLREVWFSLTDGSTTVDTYSKPAANVGDSITDEDSCFLLYDSGSIVDCALLIYGVVAR